MFAILSHVKIPFIAQHMDDIYKLFEIALSFINKGINLILGDITVLISLGLCIHYG